MKYLFLLLTVAFAISCNNTKTGSGNIIKETRKVKPFDGIAASNSIKVDIKIGAIASVMVETDDNIMPFVETTVANSILKIKLSNINNLTNCNVYVHIILPEIKSLHSSSSAEISSDETITAPKKLALKASSGSNINIKIDAPVVTADASSGASIKAVGKTREINGHSSSGSNIDFYNLHAETAKATVSSGASIFLFASRSIVANASSGGKINYHGGATSVQKNVSSGGLVNAEVK